MPFFHKKINNYRKVQKKIGIFENKVCFSCFTISPPLQIYLVILGPLVQLLSQELNYLNVYNVYTSVLLLKLDFEYRPFACHVAYSFLVVALVLLVK